MKGQLASATIELSALRKERELDRRAFDTDARRKEVALKKLLLSKRELLQQGVFLRPRTATPAGGVRASRAL